MNDVLCFGTHPLKSKKKTYGYFQRNEGKQAAFATQLAGIPLSQRVYRDEDESGMESVLKEAVS